MVLWIRITKETFSGGHFLTEGCVSFTFLRVLRMKHLVSDHISIKWQPETELYREEAEDTLQLLSAVRHFRQKQGTRLSVHFWFWWWYSLEILLVLSLQTQALSNSSFNWQDKTEDKNVNEHGWKLKAISVVGILYISSALSVLRIVRIHFNFVLTKSLSGRGWKGPLEII